MELRNTVLENVLEANTFQTLALRWSPKFKIFPSLPLLKIFQVDSEELDAKELWYFQKSSVDYTICLANNQPILSIEFEGVNGGFSRDGIYSPEQKIIDPMGNHRTDLMLKVAKRVNYPLMLISYEDVKNFDEEDTMTILFGVIKQLFAQEEFQQCFQETVGEPDEENEEIHGYGNYENIQGWRESPENETGLTKDPITTKGVEYEQRCAEFGLNKHRFDYLIDPPLFGIKNIFDEEIIQSRIKAMKQIVRVGCRVAVENSNIAIAQSVWIQNSEFFEVNPLSMAKTIAQYLAFKRIYSLLLFRSKDSETEHSPS